MDQQRSHADPIRDGRRLEQGVLDQARAEALALLGLDAICAYNAEGKPARTWPLQFLVRRTAQHVMDHAWELEDRDLTS